MNQPVHASDLFQSQPVPSQPRLDASAFSCPQPAPDTYPAPPQYVYIIHLSRTQLPALPPSSDSPWPYVCHQPSRGIVILEIGTQFWLGEIGSLLSVDPIGFVYLRVGWHISGAHKIQTRVCSAIETIFAL